MWQKKCENKWISIRIITLSVENIRGSVIYYYSLRVAKKKFPVIFYTWQVAKAINWSNIINIIIRERVSSSIISTLLVESKKPTKQLLQEFSHRNHVKYVFSIQFENRISRSDFPNFLKSPRFSIKMSACWEWRANNFWAIYENKTRLISKCFETLILLADPMRSFN